MAFGKKLRSLDVFKKVPKDFSEATRLGGVISIITSAMIIYFAIIEVKIYLNPPYTAQIIQDKLVTKEEMTINLDIEFPSYPCEIISLDLDDVMISHHPNIGSVEKWRLDQQGNYLDSKSFQLFREPHPIKQLDTIRTAFKNGYGCRLIGSFTVKEVPGNFHISCHAYYNHFLQMQMEGLIKSLNMTHKIHTLYFGVEHSLKRLSRLHPEASVHILEETNKTHLDGSSSHYHLDIVPTWYHEGAVTNYYTYQYTSKHNSFSHPGQPPVVHFQYAIGGLSVEVLPLPQLNLFTFLAKLCAIIGGTYAIASLLHNALENCFGTKFQYKLIQ